jgi:hypothetical protein
MHNTFTINTSSTSTIFQSEHDYSDRLPETLAIEDHIPPTGWELSLPVQLPKSFDIASQSVSMRVIQISHSLVVRAEFHNTETHTPITVFNYLFSVNEAATGN